MCPMNINGTLRGLCPSPRSGEAGFSGYNLLLDSFVVQNWRLLTKLETEDVFIFAN